MPITQTLEGGSQYLAKIEAAASNPNSVTDVDLLDSYINLAKGSGQVTEGQINAIQGGGSFTDSINVLQQKLANGGSLSGYQRNTLESLANAVYSNYQTLYAPVYMEAVNAMKGQGVPADFWTAMPNLDKLSSLSSGATTVTTK